MNPKVSIIVPAYNGERYLPATLDSVLAQTFEDWELILVDDGSTDSTPEILAAYALRDSRICGESQNNAGVACARNRGIALSNEDAPYIALLDNDDLWAPEMLETLVGILDTHEESVCAHGLVTFVDQMGRALDPGEYDSSYERRLTFDGSRIVPLQMDQPTVFATLAVWCCIPTPGAALIRRRFLNLVGELDQSVAPAEDWDLYFRLSRHGPFQFLNHSVIQYRQHVGNASRNKGLMARQSTAVLQKNLDSPENSPEQRRLLQACLRFQNKTWMLEKLKYSVVSAAKGKPLDALKQLAYAAGHFSKLIQGRP